MDCGRPGSSVHGTSQARILEWVAISPSRGSSQIRDRTRVSGTGRQILYHAATWEDPRHHLVPYISHRELHGEQVPLPGACHGSLPPSPKGPALFLAAPKDQPCSWQHPRPSATWSCLLSTHILIRDRGEVGKVGSSEWWGQGTLQLQHRVTREPRKGRSVERLRPAGSREGRTLFREARGNSLEVQWLQL